MILLELLVSEAAEEGVISLIDLTGVLEDNTLPSVTFPGKGATIQRAG
jgi:hypothetical protein